MTIASVIVHQASTCILGMTTNVMAPNITSIDQWDIYLTKSHEFIMFMYQP